MSDIASLTNTTVQPSIKLHPETFKCRDDPLRILAATEITVGLEKMCKGITEIYAGLGYDDQSWESILQYLPSICKIHWSLVTHISGEYILIWNNKINNCIFYKQKAFNTLRPKQNGHHLAFPKAFFFKLLHFLNQLKFVLEIQLTISHHWCSGNGLVLNRCWAINWTHDDQDHSSHITGPQWVKKIRYDTTKSTHFLYIDPPFHNIWICEVEIFGLARKPATDRNKLVIHIRSQVKKTKSKLQILKNCKKIKFWNFARNFTCDTPSEVAWYDV